MVHFIPVHSIPDLHVVWFPTKITNNQYITACTFCNGTLHHNSTLLIGHACKYVLIYYFFTVHILRQYYFFLPFLYRFSLSMEMSRLTRDGTAEPVSRDQILRHARGQGNIIFPVQLTTSRIGNLTRLIHTLLYVMTIHTYIHIYLGAQPDFIIKHHTAASCFS